MITNKEDFMKKRKTRLEVLEERILNAETIIEELNKELKDEGISEIQKMEKILNELREMKESIIEEEQKNNKEIKTEMNNFNQESLLLMNIEKVKVMNDNEKLKNEMEKFKEIIKNMEKELISKNVDIQKQKQYNDKILDINSEQEQEIKLLKAKAYGYDIAKKYDIYKHKINNENKNIIDPNKHRLVEDENLAYNFWERENLAQMKNPSKLDDLAKERQLWIANSSKNIDKLVNKTESRDKDHMYNNPYGNRNNGISTNMRKVSPMILNSGNIKGSY
jgi:hypothetical protein